MINVFIVDNHQLILEGLKKILREEMDMAVVGEARNAAETLERIGRARCDILLLDLGLPDKPGIEVLKEVKQQFPKMRVLILSMYPEEVFALRALKAGADGYLTKDGAARDLVSALRRVATGGKYVSDALSQRFASEASGDTLRPRHEGLSDREFQILRLIGSGKTVSSIAGELTISVSTVNTHRIHILDKLHLQTTSDLIRYALEQKLVE